MATLRTAMISLLIATLHAGADPACGQDKKPAEDRRDGLWSAPVIVRLGTHRADREGLVSTLAFSANGKVLASADNQGTLHVWEISSGKRLADLQGHAGKIVRVALSADGSRAVSAGEDGTLRIWDEAKETHRVTLDGLDHHVLAFSLRADGTVLAYTVRESLDLWEITRGRRLASRAGIDRHLASSVVVSSDGKTIFLGTADGAVHHLEALTLKESRPVQRGQDLPGVLALTSDGQSAAGIHFGREEVCIWKVASGTIRSRCQCGPASLGDEWVVFSPQGRALAVAGQDGITLFEIASGHVLKRRLPGRAPITFSADGLLLACGDEKLSAVVYRLRPTVKLKATAEELWQLLAAADPDRAFAAAIALIEDAKLANRLLAAQLKPAVGVPPERIARWIADLDADRFAVRDQAVRELTALGQVAESALRKALKANPSLETRQRLEDILKCLHGPISHPDTLRMIRAVEVLESIADADARRLLRSLAGGAAEAELTCQARAALDRLESLATGRRH